SADLDTSRTNDRSPVMIRFLHHALLTAMLVLAAASTVSAADPHRLALQITDNDADKMNAVLNVAANVSRYYSAKGEEIEVEIVAFKQGMHNVIFKACQNTIDNMSKREGKEIPIVDNAERVPAGIVRLIELSEKGWTIVRP